MSGTKILFTDLDGTLLDDKKQVSREDIGSINEMLKKGHRFVIATGRPLYSAKIVARETGLFRDGIFLAASNGGILYDCSTQQIMSKEALDADTVDMLFRAATREGLHIQTYTDTKVVSLKETPELIGYCTGIKMPYEILGNIPGDLPGPPPKVIVISIKKDSRSILMEFERKNAAMITGRARSVFSNDRLLEYLPLGASKGNALLRLCEITGIAPADSIAAGDEANDIPMLDAAGIAVVMANGTDEAKSHADYVTEHSNNESGISELIHRFVL